ncbi:MAG: site-2 protease family protein [Planctomycetes bacterium]|nr:site-2 protease family protein [Planctomycetota bacterium]
MPSLSDPATLIAHVIVFLLSVAAHEYCHAWVADRLGDDTSRRMNRLTLDPRAHIDPVMTLLLPGLLLIMSSGRFMFGQAKPVPVQTANFRHPSLGMLLTAAAGPLANLFLAAVAAAGFRAVEYDSVPWEVWADVNRGHMFALLVIETNLVLFVFNLVPIPPLDGSRVLRHFLSRSGQDLMDSLERFGLVLVVLLSTAGLGRVLGPIQTKLTEILLWQ